ncbi:hypothetical protein ABTNL_47 [Pseudomonas phage vB_PaeP_PPA-ABTNL]|uniref:Tail fiber protein n=1 Tax=Pseudomonas phage vB_PaeP_PPA-ABTNL TaxID=1527525 RepID=A0A0B4N5J6_9CAUD|nr:tail fiber protein [Pseudomonas phage vB_PaeP_PPA-ABTNL]AIK67608.1 hypothetical protein ABTNL_47 [Pseudomonas phage vB_PaeP_PPA-ABTNL]
MIQFKFGEYRTRVPFQGARDRRDINDRNDYVDGGIAIQDPSQGLLYQEWHAELLEDGIYLTPEKDRVTTRIGPGINEGVASMAVTFDQNMNYIVVYSKQGEGFIDFFDSAIEERNVMNIGPVDYIKADLDDRRPEGSAWAQVLVCYTRQGNFYIRASSTRFTEEELIIGTGKVTRPIVKCGMAANWRFQVLFRGRM